ncbi:glycosyl transferase family 2 [Clostridium sp. CAG:921]|nr:glycosyl transferase family 2 [Clostridium sp. CAG:921]
MKKIAVMIPCYNEELTIRKVVEDFKKELPDAYIYVYNNNSKDNTEKIAKDAGAIVIREYKQGKGNVVRSMFRDIDADMYVMVDGDDTYPAEEVHKLIEVVESGMADMAIGDRLSNGTYIKENKRNFHNFGNVLVKNTINFIFKSKLNDIMTGYRVFNREFVKNMPVLSPGFEIETEMTFHALDRNYSIVEVPITYRDRPVGSVSKLNTFSDGFKVLLTIFKMFKNYRPLGFFLIVAIIFWIISLIIGVPLFVEFFKTGVVTKFPSGILATGIAIFGMLSLSIGVILDTLVRQHKEQLEILRNINKEASSN